MKKTRIAATVLTLTGSALIASPTYAQTSQALERVEITGSAIRRVNKEGPTVLETVSRKDIERSGATSLNELVRTLPTIDIFDGGELGSNSPAGSGTANLSIRGLGEGNLLVLLNGRRLPVNALHDASGAGAAVDINMIPLAAIERIEILKDGASAIYGADAVAGVFNIITRKNYAGLEMRAGYGSSSRSDGREKTAGLVWGHGDLATDNFNLLFGLDLFKRDPIYRKDRDISSSADFRRLGGLDSRSSFSPAGNIYDFKTDSLSGQSYAPCPTQNFNQVCKYDFNQSVLTAYNGADRIGGMAHATVRFNPETQAFVELTYAHAQDHLEAQPVVDYFNVPITNSSQSAYEDPTNPGTVVIAGRFMQGGPRITDRTSSLFNLVTGIEGSFADTDWKISLGQGVSKISNNSHNYYNRTPWQAATSGSALNPTALSNDPALIESLKINPTRTGKSITTTLNGQLSGTLASLPAGDMKYATGFSVWHESLVDTPDLLTQNGQVVGSIKQAAVDASRTVKAVYGELAVPITEQLEAQLALRHDQYPNAQATSPKLAAKYLLQPEVALRASYARSFRAPVLKQLYGGSEQGSIDITNDDQCRKLGVATPCIITASAVSGSNPNLQPEYGRTISWGTIFDFNHNSSASVDFWQIKKTNEIDSPTVAEAINSGSFTRNGPQYLIYTNLQNIARKEVAGVDLDGRLRLPGMIVGTTTLRNTLTYYEYIRKTLTDGSGALADFNGTYRYPRWRNTFSATFEMGHMVWQGNIRTVAGFWDQDTPAPISSDTRRVPSHTELDIQGQYSGIQNWILTGGIKNLLDRMPPFSQTNASDGQYTQLGFAELYNNRGRFLYLSGNYKF